MTLTTNVMPTQVATLTADSTDDQLFRALATADGAEKERIQELLVRRYDGLVRWLAGRYAGRAVESDELCQVGYVGLVLAIQRFDPDRGFDFASFAKPTVQGEIRRYFRDKRRWIRLPRRLQETKAVLRDATETLTHELGRSPTVDELAERLAVSPDLVLEALTADDAFAPTSLDAAVGSDGDDTYTIADTMGEEDKSIDLMVDCETVRPLIAALPQREQRILHLRFFADKTQAEIGQELGISQMHVSRLLSRTLASLRQQMSVE
jgi:RNA polymerase sigma-B factor